MYISAYLATSQYPLSRNPFQAPITDGKGTFARGVYQGVTRDHYVEIDLGQEVPVTGPLWLLASGWIRPTDSSINIAISQGRHAPPQSLRLEVPDGQGGWVVARAGLGFPAGKTKPILIDLQSLWRPDIPRLLRLRTNMETYWDAFAWASALPDAELKTQRLSPWIPRGFCACTDLNAAKMREG